MGVDAGGRGGPEARAPGLRQRFRYRFDNLLARGMWATLIWLGVVTIAAVLVSSLMLRIAGVALSGSQDGAWLEDVWQSLLRTIDPGTMANDVGWGRRILALVITAFGLLVTGTLIGIIAAGVEDRIDRMRRGRSVVIESDHIVVLGASSRLPVLLQQLGLTAVGEGRRRLPIVLLADLDPAEIRKTATGVAHGRGRARIVYRSGDRTSPDDLALVRLATARTAIVLADQRSDTSAIETVLAMHAALGSFDNLRVVVELMTEDGARRLHSAYGTSVHTIVTSEAVTRTVAFALRQPGLSQVLEELLDFEGSDLNVVELPELVGSTFGSLVRGMTNARPLGIQRDGGRIELNPGSDAVVEPGDCIILVTDDVNEIQLSPPGTDLDPEAEDGRTWSPEAAAERVVVVGWNDLGSHVLTGWAHSAPPTSAVDVLVDPREVDPDSVSLPDLGSVSVSLAVSDDPVADAAAHDPTTIVLLAPLGGPEADVRTILDLQALRSALAVRGETAPRVVVELHDAAHRSLLDAGGPDDLIISDAMGSKFIAQLADQPARRDVLLHLYGERDASMRLAPCAQLGIAGDCSVREIVDRGVARGMLVLGWRRSAARGGDVTLNPHLSTRVHLDPDDELVVVG